MLALAIITILQMSRLVPGHRGCGADDARWPPFAGYQEAGTTRHER